MEEGQRHVIEVLTNSLDMKQRKVVGSMLTVLVIGGVLGFTGLTLIGNKEEADSKVYRKPPELLPLVQTHQIKPGSFEVTDKFLGTFQPNREIEMLAETNGKVVYVGVERGQPIQRGQLIAKLDDDVMRAQMIATKASYEKALDDVKRYEDAVANNAMPAINLENAKLGLKSAESQLKLLETQIAQTSITAPFSGVVTMKMFEIGSVLAPGKPVIQLTDISKLRLLVNIPEGQVNSLKVGERLPVETDLYPGAQLRGTILNIAAKGDAAHNFETEILVENSREYPLRAGMYGSVSLIKNKSGVMLIPRVAVVGSSKDPKVYLVKDDTAYLKNVSLGAAYGEVVELTSGLTAGDEIVTVGQINLSDHVAVKRIEAKESTTLRSNF